MSKTTLLLSTLLLFTGCAERGYILTTNSKIQTITAESVSSLDKESKEDEAAIFKKMTTAVKKAQKEESTTPPLLPQKQSQQTIKKKRTPKKIKKIATSKKVVKKEVIHKFIPKVKIKEEIEAPKPVEVSKTIAYSDDEENLKEQARKSQERREARLREIAELRKRTLTKASHTKNNPPKQAEKSNVRLPKTPNVDTAKNAEMEKKIAQKKEAALLAKKALEQEKLAKEKEAALLAKRNLEQEARRKEQLIKEQQQEKVKKIKALSKKDSTAFTKPLTFKQIDKIYHKFGTSEVHGHVIYLAENGQETRLSNTKIYLLPVSAKLNHWFKNYYLKNKHDGKSTIVSYLNKTSLNLERNFEFFGVPKGSYYVIIESNNPKSSNKVYIAKKIQVGKYKKVMGVFSKKL